ncbi:MAG: hypothetical protein KBT29_08815 [Prevotellaceae bacterium]|nr:hypothetical protein [Candidatus Minthosoma caballi]
MKHQKMRVWIWSTNQPQPSNDDEFDDIDRMFEEAEASGECTNEEVTKMFNV